MPDVRTAHRSEFRLWWVVRAIAGQVLPVIILALGLWAAAWWWSLKSGDSALATLAGGFATIVVLGVAGSFAVHEAAHVWVLKRLPAVTEITLERTLWRSSVVPMGSLTLKQAAWVALAGPLTCAFAGALLRVGLPASSLGWWFLAHLVFLLPCFGDGRVLLSCLRGRAPSAARTMG